MRWATVAQTPFRQELYARLPEAELYRTDADAVYGSWLLPGRHVVHLLNGAGGAVNWNEGRPNSYSWAWLRSQLNRLMRRTKGYTKSVAMLVDSVALAGQRIGAKSIIPAY